jgi:diguanylate cyclase (GGDEF)-like protein
LRKNGTVFPAEIRGQGLRYQGRTVRVTALQDISKHKQTELALQQANEKLQRGISDLEQRNHEIALLSEMSDILQACLTTSEAYRVIAHFVQLLFPNLSGAVFTITSSKNLVEAVTSWGKEPLNSQMLFSPNECWALRRGRSHYLEQGDNSLTCDHISHFVNDLDNSSVDFCRLTESLCVPMMAQGEAIGVLHLTANYLGEFTEAKRQLANTVCEHIALALANLKLRETLQNQSIRDPLTSLFNRRYLEESLEREIQRAARQQQPVGIIMLDVDHFKRFNDTFGHDAGDAVLRELGSFLKKCIRGSDIACRYGGEELTLILPEASLEITKQRAETIREQVKQLMLEHRRQPLGVITLSLGVACFPEHGKSGEAVIHAADAALYCAKREGRDRVVCA